MADLSSSGIFDENVSLSLCHAVSILLHLPFSLTYRVPDASGVCPYYETCKEFTHALFEPNSEDTIIRQYFDYYDTTISTHTPVVYSFLCRNLVLFAPTTEEFTIRVDATPRGEHGSGVRLTPREDWRKRAVSSRNTSWINPKLSSDQLPSFCSSKRMTWTSIRRAFKFVRSRSGPALEEKKENHGRKMTLIH